MNHKADAIGKRLREERVRLCLIQQDFARIGGVAPNTQGHYESGQRAPGSEYLLAIAAAGKVMYEIFRVNICFI